MIFFHNCKGPNPIHIRVRESPGYHQVHCIIKLVPIFMNLALFIHNSEFLTVLIISWMKCNNVKLDVREMPCSLPGWG